MATISLADPRRSRCAGPCRHDGPCRPPCEGCGWVECRCEEIAANLAANPPCPTCDSDQVIVTCGECEGGLVWDEGGEAWDDDDVVTCPACDGAYSIPCPDCGGE